MIHLPVEIWRRILFHAIEVPDLFMKDLTPVTEISSAIGYWKSERTRSALRRVCSSWNDFLASYDGRYVQISDIIHGTVPAAQLARALRINLMYCNCEVCYWF
ncbi:hypothetical protein PIIN_11405 [Serendipita indica DSM 11827]|uniref:F-box domain-containing protein n=1 Tax=Serendipita indica (strain DSM 11827) TaxID=1109443 RepID=G4U1I5_SERID|nr:hypothetical protein PIIN_11405 [Serendipita indica DSM 11827]